MFYSFGFLTLSQTYKCMNTPDSEEVSCTNLEICAPSDAHVLYSWRYETENPNFLINWIQEMDLMCEKRTTINWIVTVYYIAFGLAGLLMWKLPDKLGNRTTFKIFGTIHVIVWWLMLLIPNYWIRLGAFAVMGFC